MSRKSELLTNSIKDNYIKSVVIFLEEDCDVANIVFQKTFQKILIIQGLNQLTISHKQNPLKYCEL